MKCSHDMYTRDNSFHTNTPLCFDAFQCSESNIQKVFCSSIHWRIQNPAKHLTWCFLREQLLEKNSMTVENIFFMISVDGK